MSNRQILFNDPIQGAPRLKALTEDRNWWSNRVTHINALLDIEQILCQIVHQCIVADSAIIEENARITGAVIICEHTVIRSGAYIVGPAIIGEHCYIGPNCFLNGNLVIGPETEIAQGAELKGSILLGAVTMCHFSYIGDSIVGRNVNVAAGVITAVRRFDGGTIMVRLPGHELDTKRRKFGALIGDHVQLGIGVLIYPGRTIEPGVCVPPGFVVRRNYPSV